MLGTIMQSFMILSVVSILWILFGYSLAFGPDKGGVIGGLDRVERGRCGAPPDVWADDSSLGLHAVPTDVCGAHCRRGSDLVRCCCFQPYGRSWSMCHWHIGFGGGRMARQDGRGGPHQFRALGAGVRARAGQAAWVRHGLYGAP